MVRSLNYPPEIRFSDSNRSRQNAIILSFAMVLILALADFFTHYINISILYFIPIAFCAKSGRRKPLLWMTAIVVLLTYVLYFIDFTGLTPSFGLKLWYRLINRTMVAAGLCLTAGIMSAWTRVHDEWQRRAANIAEPDQDTAFDQAVTSLRRVIVVMLCSILIFIILVTDLMSPRQFNLPILYAVPLIIAAWADSRRLIWILLPILLASTWMAYFLGPPVSLPSTATPPANILNLILTNRILATFAQIGIAVIIHIAMTPRSSLQPRGFDMISSPSVAS